MYVRDTLLRTAEAGLFVPRWSAQILAELRRALERRQSRENTDRLLALMEAAFPDARIRVPAKLVGEQTNHREDRHVLAAALASRADYLVTENTRHFPPHLRLLQAPTVVTPDEFLCRILSHAPTRMLGVVARQARDYDAPALDTCALLAILSRSAPRFAAATLTLLADRDT